MFSRKDDKDLESSGRGGTQDSDWPEAAWGAGRKENPLEGSGPGVPAELGDWVERGEGGVEEELQMQSRGPRRSSEPVERRCFSRRCPGCLSAAPTDPVPPRTSPCVSGFRFPASERTELLVADPGHR